MQRFWKGIIVLVAIPLAVAVAAAFVVDWLRSRDSVQPQSTNQLASQGDHPTSRQQTGKTIVVGKTTDVRDTVPPEKRIEQLQYQSDQFKAEITRSETALAKRSVETDKLADEIAKIQKELGEKNAALDSMKKALEATTGKEVVIAGKTFSREQVERNLTRQGKEVEEQDKALRTKQQLLEARRAADESEKTKLNTMVDKHKQLETTIAKLRSALEQARLGGAGSISNETQVRDIEKRLHDIEDQVKITTEELKLKSEPEPK